MRESVSLFGKAESLVGILTDPPAGVLTSPPETPAGILTNRPGTPASALTNRPETDRGRDLPAVILLNAGIVHRVGPNRLHVKLARTLSPTGFVVFRFDFSGTGDSLVRSDNLPFEESAVSETQEAMEHVSAARGSKRFILLGISSGAMVSYKTACRDPRVAGAVLINPQTYGQDLWSYVKARRYWRNAFSDPRRWLRAVTGRAKYRVIGSRLRSLLSNRKKALSAATDIAAEFRSLIERGVDLRLVYSRGDLGVDFLDVIFGERRRELEARGKLKVEIIENGDHTCTPLKSQQALLAVVRASVQAIADG
jgi:pimeloyl-ACP methyl ester carboxylesterase